MNTRSLIVLALLMGVAAAVPAKGARFKGGGSHGGSHAHAGAESTGGSLPLPSLRARSGGNPSAPADAASAPGAAAAPQAALRDRLNAELAAQRAATPPAPPLGLPPLARASAPDAAGSGVRQARRAPVGQSAAVAPMKPADLTALAPRDSARPAASAAERREDYRYNARGVNCSLYPARCG